MLFSEETRAIIEGLLFITNEPLDLAMLADLAEVAVDEAADLVAEIAQDYERKGHGITVRQISGGYMLATKAAIKPYVEKLYKPQLSNLSPAALETLAIVAYRQPITRGEVEILRGVKSDKIFQTLTGKNLIEEQGRKDAPGRPILYGTTKAFLQYFGLNALSDLPREDIATVNQGAQAEKTAAEEE